MNAPTKSDFSFSRVWDDTLKMLGANAGLLTAIAGVFLFLPAVLVAHFVPPPEGGTTPAEMIELMISWWQSNAHWMLLSALVNLGYQRQAAEKALDRVLEESPDSGFEAALKSTLRRLMKG